MPPEGEVAQQQGGMPVGGGNKTRRASSLDALRGLAILGMVLSGFLPYMNHTLPAWMYHGQSPPPTHAFAPHISGITWVDLVFPLFLFSMGAAIPLALSRRLHDGAGRIGLAFMVFGRGLLLLFFALYRQNLRPDLLVANHGRLAWGIGICAFIVLFAIFTRLPSHWPSWRRFMLRAVGWIAAIVLLASVRHADGTSFSVHRHDIILVLLANVVVSTSLVWLWSPHRYTGRLCVMALVITGHLARRYAPWGFSVTELNFLSPVLGERIFNGLIWACSPAYQKYLLITLPGTIVGDVLVTWLRPAAQRLSFSIQDSRWGQLSLLRCACLAAICLAIVVFGIAGLSFNDWRFVASISAALGAAGFILLYSPPGRSRMKLSSARQRQPRVSALLFRALFGWGMIWLVLGLALFPYQQGIRKDPATLSYLFVTAGLGHMCLIFFAVLTETFHKPAPLFLLRDNGQNPMIAYVVPGMVILPILHLIPGTDGQTAWELILAQTATPWAGFWRAIILTLLTAILVSIITRLRIFWRT